MKRLISKFDFQIKNNKPILRMRSLCSRIFRIPTRLCCTFLAWTFNTFYKVVLQITLILLSFYKLLISPFLGSCCRFYPSCSDYAYESLIKHGLFSGGGLAFKRLSRCHPFCSGGIDWVPDKISEPVQHYCQNLRKTVPAKYVFDVRIKKSTQRDTKQKQFCVSSNCDKPPY